MKLQDRLPEGVTVEGRFYKCNFDFRNVLDMIDILSREDLMQDAREYNALKCVMKHPPKDKRPVLNAIKTLLFVSKPKNEESSKERITDFDQDAGMIRAAFLQSYGINLYKDPLHWFEFRDLLNAIPEGSRYSEVVGIRARPIPAPTKWNQSEIAWLVNAKNSVALEMTEEERQKKYEQDVQNVAQSIMNFFGIGSDE